MCFVFNQCLKVSFFCFLFFNFLLVCFQAKVVKNASHFPLFHNLYHHVYYIHLALKENKNDLYFY